MLAYIRKSNERLMADLLVTADIKINGGRPWDILIKNNDLFDRISINGSLGLGEAYMDNWWECEALDQFFYKLLRHRLDRKFRANFPSPIFNSPQVHYFQLPKQAEGHLKWVKNTMMRATTCSQRCLIPTWPTAAATGQRQRSARGPRGQTGDDLPKTRLAPGMRLLDIGCGWGSLIRYAARNYGVTAVGLTISKEQAALAKERCTGLPVEILLQDYRQTEGIFDAVASVGMFEHVGYKNYRDFMQVARRCLKDDGLFLLHTIAANNSVRNCDPWFENIFSPTACCLPSSRSAPPSKSGFIMEDWHNFGVNYDRTLWPGMKISSATGIC